MAVGKAWPLWFDRTMPRQIRTRDLTDRQLHAAIADAFVAFRFTDSIHQTALACVKLEKLLDEEQRRIHDGRSRCVCETCLFVSDSFGEDWPPKLDTPG